MCERKTRRRSCDESSNLIRRQYPDGSVFSYACDGENRLSSVTGPDGTTGYSYDAAGNLTRTQPPAANGHWQSRAYDRAGRLVVLQNAAAAGTISAEAYLLDPVGNPRRVGSLFRAPADDDDDGDAELRAEVTSYAYDQQDRLSEVCYRLSCPGAADPLIRWSYDPVGNRLTETRPSGATGYAYDAADQLRSQSGLGGAKSYSYDGNGNQTQAGGRSFAYDQANRLLSSTLATETTGYGYDGDGKRLRAGPTSFLWDIAYGLPELALERDPSGATIRRYAYGMELLSMRAAGQERYFHSDPLGSILNTTSATGKLERSYAYEPYGALRRQHRHGPGSADNPIRYTGAYHDTETGLYHLRARQYDPASGRFTSTDPLTPLLTDPYVSSYIYANNLPSALVDPGGMGAVRGTGPTSMSPTTANIAPLAIAIAVRAVPVIVAALRAANQTRAIALVALARTQIAHNPGHGQIWPVAKDAWGRLSVLLPKGAGTPVLANNNRGLRFFGVGGGPGLHKTVTEARIMLPKPGYPNGYVVYYNSFGNRIHPITGGLLRTTDAAAHISLSP